jgi:ABC-type glutathione transport system ATPase component
VSRLLEIRGPSVRYPRPGRQPPMTALDGVDLDVDSGETMGIVGESGSGKTTLGNVILGLVHPAAGSVVLGGDDITTAGPKRRRELSRDLQIVFQDPYGSLNPMRTVAQTLEEPLLAHLSLTPAAAARPGGGCASRYPGVSPAGSGSASRLRGP